MYDVYYTTGGGPWVNAGTDMWVNQWLELISPKLNVKPILLIHRNKPQGHEEYEFPIETHWRGENIDGFDELCSGARRIKYCQKPSWYRRVHRMGTLFIIRLGTRSRRVGNPQYMDWFILHKISKYKHTEFLRVQTSQTTFRFHECWVCC